MHKFAKKVYISMLSIALICITMFATTYAWVGMLTNSTFDEFEIGLSSSKVSAYDVELSLTGEQGSFHSSIDKTELKKILLQNMGYGTVTTANADDIFKTVYLSQATVKREDNPLYTGPGGSEPRYLNTFEKRTDAQGNVGYFTNENEDITNKIFTFDLYVSVAKVASVDSSTSTSGDTSDYALDIYLEGDLFSSKKNQKAMINRYQYPSDFVNTAVNGLQGGTLINGNISVKPEYACRISIQKYDTVDKYHPEQYSGNNNVKNLIIYEGGSHLPTYTAEKGYSFGGVLQDPINLALSDWNKMNVDYKKTVPEWAINRGDIEYDYNDLNQIIEKSDNVTINTMVKLTICFWFEGWDADCFSVVDKNPVDLKFLFTTKEKYD